MAKKVYELKGMNGYRLITQYMGVPVDCEFKGGNTLHGIGGRLVTSNEFVQDALEADARFNSLYILKETYEDEADRKKAKTNVKKSTNKTEDTGSKDKSKVVKTVKTFNDASDYFANEGEVCESADDIEVLCAKYGVAFPNLSL